MKEKERTKPAGLIFPPYCSAALNVPSVNLAKQWIKPNGEDLWGV